MNKIKTYFRKLRYALKHDFFSIENVILIISIVLCLTWTYQSILAMSRNWELSEKITAQKRELELLNIEVESAELENIYYQTEEYQELLARKTLDKKFPDENMVVMPENSESAKNKHNQTAPSITPKSYSNFEKWLKFLFPTY